MVAKHQTFNPLKPFKFHIVIVMFIFILLSNCSSVKVVSHQTPGMNVYDFMTFSIHSNENLSSSNLRAKDQIEGAILKEMELRGYEFSQEHEILVYYRIILGTDTDVRSDRQLVPYYGRVYNFNTVSVDRYNTGVLLIEIKKSSNNRIIWQGSIDLKTNSRSRKPLALEELISLIYQQFPTPPEQ